MEKSKGYEEEEKNNLLQKHCFSFTNTIFKKDDFDKMFTYDDLDKEYEEDKLLRIKFNILLNNESKYKFKNKKQIEREILGLYENKRFSFTEVIYEPKFSEFLHLTDLDFKTITFRVEVFDNLYLSFFGMNYNQLKKKHKKFYNESIQYFKSFKILPDQVFECFPFIRLLNLECNINKDSDFQIFLNKLKNNEIYDDRIKYICNNNDEFKECKKVINKHINFNIIK